MSKPSARGGSRTHVLLVGDGEDERRENDTPDDGEAGRSVREAEVLPHILPLRARERTSDEVDSPKVSLRATTASKRVRRTM